MLLFIDFQYITIIKHYIWYIILRLVFWESPGTNITSLYCKSLKHSSSSVPISKQARCPARKPRVASSIPGRDIYFYFACFPTLQPGGVPILANCWECCGGGDDPHSGLLLGVIARDNLSTIHLYYFNNFEPYVPDLHDFVNMIFYYPVLWKFALWLSPTLEDVIQL